MMNNYCFNEAHRQAIKILFGIDDACGIGLQWQSDGRIIVDIDRTPKPKRFVLPMPSGRQSGDKGSTRFARKLGSDGWTPTKARHPLGEAMDLAGYHVTQADIDAAPDWVKAIKPVEVRDEREIKFRYWTGDQLVQVHRLTFNDDEFTVEGEGVVHFANAKSLMQFTGLHDADDEEIYEGDFLTSDADGAIHLPWQVVYAEGAFRLTNLGMPADVGKVLESYISEGMFVAGNIYENPDLLEASK